MYTADNMIFNCPVEALSTILGKKWVAVIIWELQNKKMRFGELERAVIGCSRKMLIQQLDLLISQGIIINEKKSENNSVESIYYLSSAGLSLLPIMKSMIGWSNKNLSCGKN